MKIAVISEISACDKNSDIVAALEDRGHEILNVGMKDRKKDDELTYIHTGLLSAILLNMKKVDLVVGGCGTGQGYLNSVMQYPGIFCGLIEAPLDAWLFSRINNGNCISLALNKGYGWGGVINLKLLFDAFFSAGQGEGYPEIRKDSQALSRESLLRISEEAHYPLYKIIQKLDDVIINRVLNYPGVSKILDVENISDVLLRKEFIKRIR